MKNLIAVLAVCMGVSGVAQAGWDDYKDGLQDVQKKSEAHTDSYKEDGRYGVRSAKGVISTVGGNTIKYSARAVEILGDGGMAVVDETVGAGQCASDSGRAGEFVACGFDWAGNGVMVVADATGDTFANTVYYVTETPADFVEVFGYAFDQCYADMNEKFAPGAWACKGVAIVFNTTGNVIRTAGIIVGEGVAEMGYGAGNMAFEVISIPAELFRGNVQEALISVPKSVFYAGCATAQVPMAAFRAIHWAISFGKSLPKTFSCKNIDWEEMNNNPEENPFLDTDYM